MKAQALILLLMAILQTILAKTYSRLEPGMQLNKGDELISTLGFFKLIMNDDDCSLNFYKFDAKSLTFTSMKAKYSGNINGSCSYLKIIDHRILTNSSNVFLQLSSSNLSKIYLIIDDNAILRFIGLKSPSGNVNPSDYEQIQYNNYSQLSQFVSILDSFNQMSDKFTAASNNKNWMFQLSNQILTITNPVQRISSNFNLPLVYFELNGIYDENNETLPGATFDGLRHEIACGGGKSHLYGPFVLEIDQYWPKATIYDQEKYKVFEYSIIQNEESTNPCPKFTFSINNQCLTSCPTPYFNSIEGSWGKCVLNCEYGSVIDNTTNTCKCPNKISYISPNYNCLNSSSYSFGCFCQNNTYFDKTSHSCLAKCTNQLQPYLGLCINCSKGCTQCSITNSSLYILTCTQCSPGFSLNNGICQYSTPCSSNCLFCPNSVCTICQPFYVLSNGTCKQSCVTGQGVLMQDLTSVCTSQVPVDNCNIDCLKCSSDSTCVVCKPGYALLVTPISITCRKKNLFYNCKSALYSPSSNSNICYSNDSSSLSILSNCVSSISNCKICHYNLKNICLLCNQGYLLQQNKCITKCSSNYFSVNQGCIPAINHCEVSSFYSLSYPELIAYGTVNNSQYLRLVNNHMESTNQPYGFGLYFKSLFMFQSQGNNSVNSNIASMKQSCSQCQKGYGLTPDHSSCIPCPKDCLLCLYASFCLATTKEQLLSLTLGSGISSCQNFISEDETCVASCPSSTYPTFNTTLQMVSCTSTSESNVQGYLRIDGSTFKISDNKYIHRFVFDSPIAFIGRLLQANNLTIDASGNSITFESSKSTQILNLAGTLSSFSASNGQYPANSIYGINSQTSFRSYIKNWLAGIGYVLSILIIIIHCIYIANNILYKMDNIIIFAQSLYYFLFNQVLIANPIAQYYYGFSWAHLNFFPNYFQPELDLSQPTVPPYALYNLDANVIRNSGSTLSLLLTFTLIWLVVSIAIYIIDNIYGRKELWYENISKNSYIAAIEFFSYNVFYWCIAFINYDKNYSKSGTFIGLAVLLLTIFIIYTVARLYFNLIGGLYMVKRLIYACILASSYENVGYVGIIIVIEGLFGVARSVIEKPREKWMLIALWIEQGLIIVFLIILYTANNVGVISILTTVFVYGWMLTFIADLSDLYFSSKNKYLEMGCFKNLFEEEREICKSSESSEKGDTDRPINSIQKH